MASDSSQSETSVFVVRVVHSWLQKVLLWGLSIDSLFQFWHRFLRSLEVLVNGIEHHDEARSLYIPWLQGSMKVVLVLNSSTYLFLTGLSYSVRGSCRSCMPYMCCILCFWLASSPLWGGSCWCWSGSSRKLLLSYIVPSTSDVNTADFALIINFCVVIHVPPMDWGGLEFGFVQCHGFLLPMGCSLLCDCHSLWKLRPTRWHCSSEFPWSGADQS